MKKKEVPQDSGILDRWHEICYAVDDNGKYILSPSSGWEPANIANQQAWELIKEQVQDALRKIEAGELSPLAYHMARHQMDEKLLAKYVGFPRWRVRRHLRPSIFKRLKKSVLERYAKIFSISLEELETVPHLRSE